MISFFRMRRTSILLLFIAFSVSGCAVGEYFAERGRDFLDIVDLKIQPIGIGLGAKVQFTDYLAAGFGMGTYLGEIEKYGRFWHKNTKGHSVVWVHTGLLGIEYAGENSEVYVLIVQPFWGNSIPQPYASWENRLRVGFEVCLPLFNFGLFVNLGQIADFILGFFGIDLIDDEREKWIRFD